MKRTVIEMKSSLDRLSNRFEMPEKRKINKKCSRREKKKNIEKSRQSLGDLWDNVRHFNMGVMRVLDRKEGEKGTEKNI